SIKRSLAVQEKFVASPQRLSVTITRRSELPHATALQQHPRATALQRPHDGPGALCSKRGLRRSVIDTTYSHFDLGSSHFLTRSCSSASALATAPIRRHRAGKPTRARNRCSLRRSNPVAR